VVALVQLAACPAMPACAAQSRRPADTRAVATDTTAVLLEAALRSARLYLSLLDSNLENANQEVQWNRAGEFKRVTEVRMVDGRLMFRPLLLPGAPWISVPGRTAGGEILHVAREGAPAEKVGKVHVQSFSLPGQKTTHQTIMWKTTETNGKWVGAKFPEIYECGDDGKGAQIGTLGFGELAIESGEVVLVIESKGMAPGSVWEGDVGDTTYRESTEGKGTPIAKLAYRPVKLEDGTETVVLMSRPLSGKAIWTGVRNGKVIVSAGK